MALNWQSKVNLQSVLLFLSIVLHYMVPNSYIVSGPLGDYIFDLAMLLLQ
jgi:hypothetical protein